MEPILFKHDPYKKIGMFENTEVITKINPENGEEEVESIVFYGKINDEIKCN